MTDHEVPRTPLENVVDTIRYLINDLDSIKETLDVHTRTLNNMRRSFQDMLEQAASRLSAATDEESMSHMAKIVMAQQCLMRLGLTTSSLMHVTASAGATALYLKSIDNPELGSSEGCPF